MRKDRKKALQLRLGGKSYNEISKALGVPKSTLSGWLGSLELSRPARERIQKRVAEGSLRGLIKRNKNQTLLAVQRMHATRDASSREISNISGNALRLIGVALYWAEGYKRAIQINGRERTHHPVSLTNSDPILARVFMRFLREVCDVPDQMIRIDVRLFEHMEKDAVIKYWIKELNLRRENFKHISRTVSRSSMGQRPFNRLPYGTIQIRVNQTALFHRIMGWIEGMQKQCMAA